jgi:hypothetical protein
MTAVRRDGAARSDEAIFDAELLCRFAARDGAGIAR